VEIVDSKVDELLWSYNLPNGSSFLDAELADLNNDGYLEIIVIAKNPVFSINQNWLYVFKGREKLFENNPITSNYLSLDLGTTIRPLNISKIPDTQNQIAVAFGTPIRKAMIFNLLIGDSDLEIEKIKLLRAPIIENGYGHIFASGFKNNNKTFFAILSPENNKIKTAVFDMDSDAVLLKSDILLVGDATHLIGAGIQPNKGEDGISDGLIIPYGSDDMFLLEINGSELLFNKTDVAEGKTPQVVKFNNGKLEKKTINKTRLNDSNIQTGGMNLINKDDDSLIPPPLPEEKNEKLDFDKITSLPYDYKETQLKQKIVPENKKNDFDILTPTIGDYLSSIKTNAINKQDDIEKITIPNYNEEMNVDMIADEAGFEKVNVDLPFDEVKETENIDNLPSLDEEILTFSNSIKEKIAFRPMVDDSSLFSPVEGEIDLYYVMAITPSIKDSKDRYVFDGEAPFGVSVNQIPQLGQPSHFQHSISANLNGLRPGETFDFAYSLRKSNMDSITTLVMVHDLQTNVFFISVLPSHDSLSQSYQPESFDPTLFEFPNYFFEGFPTSLGMDFADRLIRFSFDGSTDSVVHRGIYLSSTTPSLPPQSLAVFMDEGKLQSIRGEVIVRQNGSKKITTEFDLSGGIKPSVMFSHLLKEEFPDSLKFQLLKDGSIKKPLFGPQGKLPKITKAERLPDAQSDQSDPEIPVVPIQSIVPKSEKFTPVLLSSDKDSNITKTSPTKSDEESERIQTAADSLKLEKAKTVVVNKEIGNKQQKEPTPPVPEMSQPESLVPKPTFPDQNPNNDQPEIDIDPTISNENSKKNSAGSDENIISEDETRAKTDQGFKEPSGEEVVIPDNNNQNEPKDN
tara:strand:+ start:178 stop:2739 length:2562 start_codon:yes stop_codon:yes gene_type:complete